MIDDQLQELYPDDCDAECSERAVYAVWYQPPPPGKGYRRVMRACDEHRGEILTTALDASCYGSCEVVEI